MKLNPRRARQDPASQVDEEPDAVVDEQQAWTAKQAVTTKLVRYAVIGALVAGPTALIYVAATGSSEQPQKVAATTAVDDSNRRAEVGDFASQLVVAWLQAGRDDAGRLSAFMNADSLTLPNEPAFTATDPAVAGIEEVRAPINASAPSLGDTSLRLPTYTVTISVSVAPVAGDASAVRRYFQVPVLIVAENMRAANAPSPVAGPSTASDLQLGYRDRVDTQSPLGMSVTQFLSALLAGQGDITRFVTPGTQIRPVSPTAYTAVELTDLVSVDPIEASAVAAPRDGLQVRVLATAAVTDEQNATMSVQYPLTVTGRAGRWEITKIDRTPLVPAALQSPPAQSSTASQPPTSESGRSITDPGQSGSSTPSSATAPSTPTPTTGQLLNPPAPR